MGKTVKTLLITDTFVMFYEKKKDKRQTFSWLELNGVKFTGKEVRLQFGKKKLWFAPEKGDAVEESFSVICNVLGHVLSEKEYKRFEDVAKFRPWEEKFTVRGAMARSKQIAELKRVDLGAEGWRVFEWMFMTQQKVIDMKTFGASARLAVPVLVNVLPLATHVESVKFTACESENGILKDLAYDLASLEGLVHLALETTTSEKFTKFLEWLKPATQNLEGFSLAGIALDGNQMTELAQFVTEMRLCSLGFAANALAMDLLSGQFYEFLGNVAEHVKVLVLDTLFGVDVRQLMPKLGGIVVLSMNGCGVDVGTVFDEMSKNNLSNLVEVYVSSNTCGNFGKIESVPPALQKVVADGIDWKGSANFTNFLDLVLGHMHEEFKLSVAYAKVNGSEWVNVFKFIDKVDCDATCLNALGWSGNPTHKKLMEFLRECTELKYLTISDCYGEGSNSDEIEVLRNYMRHCKSLETLVMRGTPQNQLRSRAKTVLQAIEKVKTLKALDFSGNEIGDAGLVDIKELLAVNSLEFVAFDGSKPSSIQVYKDILESNQGTRFNFPFADVMALVDSHMISDDDYSQLRQKWSGDTGTPESPLDENLIVPDHHFDELFVCKGYLKRSEIPTPNPGKPTPKKTGLNRKRLSDSESSSSPKKNRKPKRDQESDSYSSPKKNRKPKRDQESDSYSSPPPKKRKSTSKRISDSDSYSLPQQKKRKPSPKRHLDSDSDSPPPRKVNKKRIPSDDESYSSERYQKRKSPKDSKRKPKVFDDFSLRTKMKPSKKVVVTQQDYSDDDYRRPRPKPKAKPKKSFEVGTYYDKTHVRKESSSKKRLNDSSSDEFARPPPKRRPAPTPPRVPIRKIIDEEEDNEPVYIPPKRSPVKQRMAPSLHDLDETVIGKKRMFNEDDEEDDVRPKPPDWSYPLRYIPKPTDVEQLVSDLNEKYSVAALLSFVKNS